MIPIRTIIIFSELAARCPHFAICNKQNISFTEVNSKKIILSERAKCGKSMSHTLQGKNKDSYTEATSYLIYRECMLLK